MLIIHYKSKKELKESIGKSLKYTETSLFGPEYLSNGTFCATNHPKRSFFARITMKNDIISKIE